MRQGDRPFLSDGFIVKLCVIHYTSVPLPAAAFRICEGVRLYFSFHIYRWCKNVDRAVATMVMRAGVAIGIAGFCSILTRPLCACLSAAVLLSAMSVGVAAPKRVLLLQSFGSQFEGGAKDIRAELGRQYPEALDAYEISLTDTSADQSVEDLFADYLRALLSDRQLDVVVTIVNAGAKMHRLAGAKIHQ
jgi:hypothetical protein